MKRKQVLFHQGRHEAPMLAVLKRYGIGSPDRHNRGRWVTETDINAVMRQMNNDPSRIVAGGKSFVQGTNQHNYVEIEDFWRVFNGRIA